MKTSRINLSLTKESPEQVFIKKRLAVIRSVAVGFLFVTGSAAIILFILIASSPLPSLRKQENGLKFQMSALHTKMGKHLLINDQLQDISRIINTRDNVTKTLARLRDEIPQDVMLDSYNREEKQIIIYLSSQNLDALDGVMQAFSRLTAEEKAFKQLNLISLSIDSEHSVYSLGVELTP